MYSEAQDWAAKGGIKMECSVGSSTITLCKGDITELKTAAVVNAANPLLILGGGVAGAIRRKGGPAIQQECEKLGGTPVGTAVITTGGELKAKYVIHAVGPKMGEGGEHEKLKNATISALKIADKHDVRTITFPAVSTGIYAFPIEDCAEIMLRATIEYLQQQTKNRTCNILPFRLRQP